MADRILVSTRKGLFVLARTAGAWAIRREAFLGQNATLALAERSAWYLALNLGHFGVKLHRSTDEGQTWEECAVPAYPAGETVTMGDGKPPRPASLQLIWALQPSEGGRLWAGTLPGGLFCSEDGARSWNLVRGLWDRPERSGWFGGGYDVPGIHSVCVDPRDPRILRLAISTGGVWISSDSGESWTLGGAGLRAAYMPPGQQNNPITQDVHRMVQCGGSPDRLWVQHHNGVFRSDDGGLHWIEMADVPPSVFGFAVAVHPREPDTAWFVPAIKDEQRIPVDGRLVVTRTRDGGKSFTVLRRGLPQEHAYDLVYRHGLAVDESGNRLVMGSTTGGLWLSEDQGDSWHSLPARLPPVHAVCFA